MELRIKEAVWRFESVYASIFDSIFATGARISTVCGPLHMERNGLWSATQTGARTKDCFCHLCTILWQHTCCHVDVLAKDRMAIKFTMPVSE